MKNSETPRIPWPEKGWRMCKKRNRLSKRKIPLFFSSDHWSDNTKIFLAVEGPTSSSLGGTLINLPTSSSRLFYERPTTKNTK